ncbi:MAG: TonB-dependent receptor [Bacteroidales bacterium]|nr:TonB-dependent receptor [Bacteroidales bacterium]
MRNLFLILCLLLSTPLYSQNDSLQIHELQEVEVSTFRPISNEAFSGTTVLSAPTEVLSQYQNASLSDYLAAGTPLFIKESGYGMLSTLSLRGTAASHTKVNWEGVPINSQTMGQVDFSQLPILFFDEVSIYPGGECAVHGNGAIGGAVSLKGKVLFKDTMSLQIHSTVGSFATLHEAVKCMVSTPRIHSTTALYYRKSDNDFPFYFRKEKQYQQNASFYDYGVMENLAFRISPRQVLSAKLWHTYYDRNIQPMMQNNQNSAKYESISNQSTKLWLDYAHYTPLLWSVRLGWQADDQLYESHKIATDDWFMQTSVEKSWKKKSVVDASLKFGGEVHVIRPEVYAYLDTSVECRSDVYLLSKFTFLNKLDLTCNLRKDFVSDQIVPFSPSFSLSYWFVKKEFTRLSAGMGCSRNVNVPTLNDRYWGMIDNRDLRPEKGANTELNIGFEKMIRKYQLSAQSSLYRNSVTDWILWMPRGNIWKPVNLDHVLAKGVELSIVQKLLMKKSSVSLDVHYAYNHTEVKEGFAEMKPFENRQTPLLPSQTLSTTLYGSVGNFHYTLLGKWVGERNTTDVFEQLDPYFLMNVAADYSFELKKRDRKFLYVIDVGSQVNNLLDVAYYTMPYRAMPMRHFVFFVKLYMNKN